VNLPVESRSWIMSMKARRVEWKRDGI
jgi:hypothetical protein